MADSDPGWVQTLRAAFHSQCCHHSSLVSVRTGSSTMIVWELFQYGFQATSGKIISDTCGEEAARITTSLKKGLNEFRVLIHHLRLI